MDWERLSEIRDRQRSEQVTPEEQQVLAQYQALSAGLKRQRRRWPVHLLVASVAARLEPQPRLAWRWAWGMLASLIVVAGGMFGALQVSYTQAQEARYQRMVAEFGAVSGNEAALAHLVNFPR